ncbi:hypothetical protein A2U01_0074612, partial [Trifolium medium]|nr:hypothetical protein [Trifolium medium]
MATSSQPLSRLMRAVEIRPISMAFFYVGCGYPRAIPYYYRPSQMDLGGR